jgi:hypothetical protein
MNNSLNWKRIPETRLGHASDGWDFEARGATGGRYRIRRWNDVFIVSWYPPKRRWGPEIGTATNVVDATALARAHNDRNVAERVAS